MDPLILVILGLVVLIAVVLVLLKSNVDEEAKKHTKHQKETKVVKVAPKKKSKGNASSEFVKKFTTADYSGDVEDDHASLAELLKGANPDEVAKVHSKELKRMKKQREVSAKVAVITEQVQEVESEEEAPEEWETVPKKEKVDFAPTESGNKKNKKKGSRGPFYKKEVLEQLKADAFAKEKEAEEKEEKKDAKKKKPADGEKEKEVVPEKTDASKDKKGGKKDHKEDEKTSTKDKAKSGDDKKSVDGSKKKEHTNGQATNNNNKKEKDAPNKDTKPKSDESPKQRKHDFKPRPVNVVIKDMTSTPFIEADMDELLNSITSASTKN